MIPWPLIRYGAIVLGVGIVAWAVYAHIYDIGYDAGKADSQAFYGPLLDEVERRAHEAQGRIEAQAKASKAVNSELERTHAKQTEALTARARGAERRLAVLLRNPPGCDSDGVPGVSSGPAVPDGSAEQPERPGQVGDGPVGDLVAIAAGCEDDANRLEHFQRWYRQQAALKE
jgi:hypothetical protein